MHIILPSPKQRYLLDLQQDGFNYDPAQEVAVDLLQSLYGRLIEDELVRSKKGLFAKLCKQLAFPCDTGPIQGLYFWGGVGRGKTYLMDSFFDSLPFEMKMRVHFHRFMRRVHMDLKLLKGKKNPLDIVADNIADEARVICFDEFFVSDIADAMLFRQTF